MAEHRDKHPQLTGRWSGGGSRAPRGRRPGSDAMRAVLVAAIVLLAGALLWFRPYLARERPAIAEVPDPTPRGFEPDASFTVPGGGQACMGATALTPTSQLAQLALRPAQPGANGGPPVELVLSAPAYRATATIPGGYPGGVATLAVAPPPRATIATACLVNQGRTNVSFAGAATPGAISRSATTVDGRPVAGDIGLTFLQRAPRPLMGRLDELFTHASNLTDRLLPVWLIWALAIAVALGVPAAVVLALDRGLREDAALAHPGREP